MDVVRLYLGSLLATLVFASDPAPGQDYRAELRKLQPTVDAAIDRGVKWLVEQQLPDGSFGGVHAGLFPNGETALSVYTLLKSGLLPSHPAVARGLEWLKRHEPQKTYSTACQMLAFEATKEPGYQPKIKALLKLLLRSQTRKGGFEYPGPPRPGPDMSNAQYGALGLRAAMLAGVRVPPSALTRLMEFALDHQGPERQVRLPADPVMEGPGKTGKRKDRYDRTPSDKERNGYAAGFFYDKRRPTVTGSMTTAGMGILLIVRDCWGKKIPKAAKSRIRKAVELGLNWMRQNWTVANNPGSPAWEFYYLYGLERVGSLLLQDVVAGHPWYLEGARHLTSGGLQAKDGSWTRRAAGQLTATCFVLLFLKRATWVGRGITGKNADDDVPIAQWVSEDGDLRLRGNGTPKVALWVDGFSRAIQEKWKSGRRRPDIRVLRVSYYVDGKPIATVEGKPSRMWKGETFAAQYTFSEPGTFSVFAKAELLPPGAKRHDADTKTVTVVSGALNITVVNPASTWRTEMGRALAGNVVEKARIKVTTSTEANRRSAGDLCVDGRETTRWLCKVDDAKPRIQLRLSKPQQVQNIMVSQNLLAIGRGGRRPKPPAAVERIAVHINGSKKPTVEIDLLLDQPTRVELPAKVKLGTLRIEILKRSSGRTGSVGFSEIYLY
ncbi:MAG: hypothetical protein CMJ83_21290 [Planctomycetes bacterium]|nr:hypothetical protein [Planctomycetota bacterium]